MLSWLLYGIVVGSLLTVGAHCAERVGQLTTRPTRWVWITALLLMVVLMGVAPYRIRESSKPPSTSRVAAPTSADASARESGVIGRVTQSFEVVRRQVTGPIERTIAIPDEQLVVSSDRFLIITWTVLSTVMLLTFAVVYLWIRHVRRQWPTHELHGVRVRVAPDNGPAVIGLVHPEIIIPRWLLFSPAEEQQAVIAHEHEHIYAGDPWLLAIASIITAVLAWHPAVWWMVSRLRLAMELDCDARTIRHGFAPQTYGSILIDLTERSSGLPTNALAIADRHSHLKRRLLAMKSRRPRLAVIQGSFFGVTALLLLLTACAARMKPVEQPAEPEQWNHEDKRLSSEESNLNVATAEDSARRFFGVRENKMTFTLRGIDPSSLTTIKLSEWIPSLDPILKPILPNQMPDSVLLLIDYIPQGVFPINESVSLSQLSFKLNDIAKFEAYRGGHWAVVLFGPDAANGVINIETKETVAQLPAQLDAWSTHRIRVNPTSLPSWTWLKLFDEAEHNKLRDSVLVLVDGVKRGKFPIRQRISLSLDQLKLRPDDIHFFQKTTGTWLVASYGLDAAHGVVYVMTKKKMLEVDSINRQSKSDSSVSQP